jgi:HD superfamily phosphodiesterase
MMDITDRVRELVKPKYDALKDWPHRWPHIQDVVEKSETLTKMENISPVTSCLIAGYCHDLGRVEEEARKQRGDSSLHHALLSIEPTVGVLQKVGISEVDFDEIVEAVAVHSYRIYEGKNNVARILQDADKMSGLSSWGIVSLTKYFAGKDYIDGEEILKNWKDKKKIRELSDLVLPQIERGIVEGVMKGLKIVTEWYDMFHTKSAKSLMTEDYEYLMRCKEYLIKKFSL